MTEPLVVAAAAPAAGWGALATLFGVVVASVWLGTLASRATARGRFLDVLLPGQPRARGLDPGA